VSGGAHAPGGLCQDAPEALPVPAPEALVQEADAPEVQVRAARPAGQSQGALHPLESPLGVESSQRQGALHSAQERQEGWIGVPETVEQYNGSNAPLTTLASRKAARVLRERGQIVPIPPAGSQAGGRSSSQAGEAPLDTAAADRDSTDAPGPRGDEEQHDTGRAAPLPTGGRLTELPTPGDAEGAEARGRDMSGPIVAPDPGGDEEDIQASPAVGARPDTALSGRGDILGPSRSPSEEEDSRGASPAPEAEGRTLRPQPCTLNPQP